MAGLLMAVAVAAGGAAAAHGERFVRQRSHAHWEDVRFFRHNRANVESFASCFIAPPAWPGLYRPLSTSCYYYAGRRLFDNRLETYHAVNGILFIANAIILFAIAGRVLPGRWPLLATGLYVTRQAHAPLLVTTSEAQALLSTFFALAALACELTPAPSRLRRWAAPPLFLAALLCKETVIVVPLIVLAWHRLFDPPGRRRFPWSLLAAGAVWAALDAAARQSEGALATGFTHDVSAAVLPRLAAHLASFSNVLTAGPAQVEMPEAVTAAAFSAAGIGIVVALVTATAGVLWQGPRRLPSADVRAAAFGFAWFAAGALPFLFFADRLFMRYGYFAHAGLSIAAAAGAATAWHAGQPSE